MVKRKTAYVCNDCGSDYSHWQGQCKDCGAWNTLTEIKVANSPQAAREVRFQGYAGAGPTASGCRCSMKSIWKHCPASAAAPASSTGYWGAGWCRVRRF